MNRIVRTSNCHVFLSLLLVLMLSSFANGQNHEDTSGSMDIRYNSAGSRYKDYIIDYSYRYRIGQSRWSLTKKMFSISVVDEKEDVFYSLQGGVIVTSIIISSIFSKEKFWSRSNLRTPIFTILSIPSSNIDYKLTDKFNIGLSNNTEYVFYRTHNGERGIYYTPALNLSNWAWVYDESADLWGIQIKFGPTYFWNFDGPSSWVGWTFGGQISIGGH